MYKIDLDKKNNIFFLVVEGYMDSDEISRLADDFKDNISQMEDGLIFINDMSGFIPPSDDIYLLINEFMNQLNSKKPEKVIRILDSDNTAASVHLFMGEELSDIQYEVVTVRSLKEAMKHINAV